MFVYTLVLGQYDGSRWRRPSRYYACHFNRLLLPLSFGRCCKLHFHVPFSFHFSSSKFFCCIRHEIVSSRDLLRKVSPLQCAVDSFRRAHKDARWLLKTSIIACFEHEYQISQSIMAKAHAINNVSFTIDFTNPDTRRCAYHAHSVWRTFERFTIKFPF